MPCGAPCSRLPCNERCSKALRCKHRCPGVCGEQCPTDYCQVCCNSEKKGAEVEDLIEPRKYRDVDVNQSPIVVLGCGHFFTVNFLDGKVGMSDVYTINDSGEFIGLKDFTNVATTIPCCPQCKQPIRQHLVNRYSRVINRAINDEMSKKLLVNGQTKLQDMDSRIAKLEQDLKRAR